MNVLGLATRESFSTGMPLIVGFIVLFLVNLLCMRFVFMFGKDRRFGKAGACVAGLVIINLVFVLTTEKNLLQARETEPQPAPTQQLPPPPPRNYPFIKNHTVERAPNGEIYAVDADNYRVTLSRENPRQVFQDSFHILMGKENKTFSDEKTAINYARFAILMYYHESEPLYPESSGELADYLQLRNNPQSRKIGLMIANATEKKTDGEPAEPPTPYEEDWDIDGNVMTFDDSRTVNILKRIGPPKPYTDYEGALEFRLYSYSLRYNELVEWHFKVFKSGELWIKKLNEIREDQ